MATMTIAHMANDPCPMTIDLMANAHILLIP